MTTRTLITLTIILVCSNFKIFCQNCDCPKEFDILVKKVESDYAGFRDKVNSKTIDAYNKHTENYRLQAQKIRSFRKCTLFFEDWLRYFNDKHLSIELESNIYFTYKRIKDDAVLLRIPGFSWDDKALIDSLILTNKPEITSTPILIIDLRGNGGGADYCFTELLPLIYTNPYISKDVEWLASEGKIAFFEKALLEGNVKQGKEEELKALVDSLKNHKDSFVQTDPSDTTQMDSVYNMPRMVGVIVDDFCASSCEQFILAAQSSQKTIIFGTQTLGVLDYSNSVSEDLLTKGLRIRYPMTRSTRLPDYPIDNIGIQPDVEINLPVNLNIKSDVDEWVLFVYDYLKSK